MSDSVLMPALGESVTEGTVTRWLKQVGDQVAVDEPLLEVSTDKVDTEIPSPFAGTLTQILVAEDETVGVGTALATIGGTDEAGDAPQEQGEEQADTAAPAAPSEAPSDGADAAEEQQAAQVPAEVTEAEPQPAPMQEQAEPEQAQPAQAQQERDQQEQAQQAQDDQDDPGQTQQDQSEQPQDDQPQDEQPQESAADAPPQEAAGQDGTSPDIATEDVTMPALGESVTEGTVTRWLKQVGDEVAIDEPLLEVSTDKVDTEIPSPFAGTLTEILVAEDETVGVGTALARIGSAPADAPAQAPTQPAADEASAEPAEPAQQEQPPQGGARQQVEASPPTEAAEAAAVVQEAQAQQEDPAQPAKPSGPAPVGAGGSSGYLTPLVRKLAAEKGVDLASLTGTGVGGRIRKEDVLEAAAKAERDRAELAAQEKAAQEKAEQQKAEQEKAEQGRAAQQVEQPTPAPAGKGSPSGQVSPLRGTTEKASRLRQIIASRMVEALQSMAQLTTVVEVDVTKVARLRARSKDGFAAREGVKLTFLPFFVLAATEALKAHPKVNGVLEGNQITYHGEENVGIAVDTERGLVVPVIRGAGDLNLAGIARKVADLAARTRANKVTPDELSGATFTVTNTGSGGALFDTPIVPSGTSAILGTGAIVKRPVVATDEDGAEYIAIRSMCYLALSYDHRLVDGADASRYLAAVKKRIEDGDFESEVGA